MLGNRQNIALIERIVRGDSYLLVLVLLGLTYLAASLGPSGGLGGLLTIVTAALTLLAALRTSWVRPRVMRVAGIAAVLAVLLAGWALLIQQSTAGPRVASVLLLLLLLITPFSILRRIFRHTRVTMETVAGALDVYLLIGLIFASLFRTVAAFSSDPFFVQEPDPTTNQYLYFSFVTLATLGYGDLTPASDLGRTLVVLEALIGQVFLVTAVARVVSLLGREREERAPAGLAPRAPHAPPAETEGRSQD